MLISLAASGAGFYLPVIWVSRRVVRRQLAAREALPDATDLLLVCVEAGLSLGAALERVGREIGRAHPVLGQELAEVSRAIQAGKGREEALRDLADRLAVDEMNALVAMLVQTEALGTSLAQGLRVHAEDMRRKRFLRAEERANQLPSR
jgi:tight adherence protein C